jgi:rubrerythrin
MLAVAQAVEHYEISRYGTLAAWAEKLELSDAAELLHETLKEKKSTDEALTGLADSEIDFEAEQGEKRTRGTSSQSPGPRADARQKVLRSGTVRLLRVDMRKLRAKEHDLRRVIDPHQQHDDRGRGAIG